MSVEKLYITGGNIIPIGDGLTVETVNGKITLKGASTAETGAYPRINEDGSIEWTMPSTDTVEELQFIVSDLQSDISELQTIVGNNNMDGGEIV